MGIFLHTVFLQQDKAGDEAVEEHEQRGETEPLHTDDGGDEAKQNDHRVPHIMGIETHADHDECHYKEQGIQQRPGIATPAAHHTKQIAKGDDHERRPGTLKPAPTVGCNTIPQQTERYDGQQNSDDDESLLILILPLLGTETLGAHWFAVGC